MFNLIPWHFRFPEHFGAGTFIPRSTENFPGWKGVTYSHGGAVVSCQMRYRRTADDTRSRPNAQPTLPFMS